MKELIPYIFEHPQYGKLRVVVEEDRIYFDLFDVKKIFVKTAQQLYETIADSEGELKNFNVVMKPAKKNQHNLFYSDDIMGVETAGRKKNVAADFNFCDLSEITSASFHGDLRIAILPLSSVIILASTFWAFKIACFAALAASLAIAALAAASKLVLLM